MKIACLGEALIDLAPPSSTTLASAVSLSILPGGAPLNVAIGLSRLGSQAVFAGALSVDGFGTRLAALLDCEGVRQIPAARVANYTRLALIDHADDDAPFRFYGDAPADTQLLQDDVTKLFVDTELDGLYVSSLMMTNPSARRIQNVAITEARRRGVAVYCDPNPRLPAWPSRRQMEDAIVSLLKSSDVAKMSLDDARNLGWRTDPVTLLEWCAGQFDAQIVLTDGKDGCWAIIDGSPTRVLPPAVSDEDPTGAGDAFTSALIHRVRAGTGVRAEDLRFAAAAGALATTKRGALGAFVSEAAVVELLERGG